tara:strand:+ start:274 stop:1218 length:945 start_codon:yes stop_codon:yes gene_type:complete
MKKNLLITGGSGYLGVNLANKFKKKYKVFLGSRNQKRNREAYILTGCKDIPLDVSNINSIRDAVDYCKPKVIIHAAATKFVDISEEFPFECSDVNILGSSNVARVAIEKKISTVIGISTDKATQPIKNFYGFSKAVMEKLFLNLNNNSNTNFLCVRYGNVAWSTGSVLPIWKEMHKKNKTIYTTGSNMRRFFFDINEAVDLVNFALNNSKKFSGKILCADMKASLILDVIKAWIKEYGGTYKIIKGRKGDRFDEYLIGNNEIEHTYKIKIKNKIYYIVDPNKKVSNSVRTIISSKNSKKHNERELLELLKIGMK